MTALRSRLSLAISNSMSSIWLAKFHLSLQFFENDAARDNDSTNCYFLKPKCS